MPTIPYREFTIDVRTSRFLGWNAYVTDRCGVFLSSFSRDQEAQVVAAAKDFVDYAIQEDLGMGTFLNISGDTDGIDIGENDSTIWTYVDNQPIYVPAPALTELFVFAADSAPVNAVIGILALRGPGATKPFELFQQDFNLDAVDAQVPVSLAANPGSPSHEDPLLINFIGVFGPPIGEVFITGSGSSGGVPNGNVYSHIAATAPRSLSVVGAAAVPHSFEAFWSTLDVGFFEDGVVWLDALFPESTDTIDSFRVPAKSFVSFRFDSPVGASGDPSSSVGLPAGTTFRLMAHSRKGTGGGPTRAGGFATIKLRKVPV